LFESTLKLLKAVREVNKVIAVFFDEKDFILSDRALLQLNINDIMVYHWYQIKDFFYEATYDLRRKSNGLEDFSYHLRNDFPCRTW
jgi:hypothetical protein